MKKTAWNSVGFWTAFTVAICKLLRTQNWGRLVSRHDGRAVWCWPHNKQLIWIDTVLKATIHVISAALLLVLELKRTRGAGRRLTFTLISSTVIVSDVCQWTFTCLYGYPFSTDWSVCPCYRLQQSFLCRDRWWSSGSVESEAAIPVIQGLRTPVKKRQESHRLSESVQVFDRHTGWPHKYETCTTAGESRHDHMLRQPHPNAQRHMLRVSNVYLYMHTHAHMSHSKHYI